MTENNKLIDIKCVKQKLSVLGFIPKSGSTNLYHKLYHTHNFEILICFGTSVKNTTIDWGLIEIVRKTTSNFSQSETIVVLECVNRLLEKGYPPNRIILEKSWKLGHKGKGYLDILIKDNQDKPFLMIECKNFGYEHNKEKSNTLKDGGQLFSYYIQEKLTQYLCIYSSIINQHLEVEYKTDIILITEKIRSAENQKEAFEAWLPQTFEKKGIFEYSEPIYQIQFGGILKKDLRPITEGSGGEIFNRFSEILRKNVISDKTNAFNKIFNLFLCKIVDEDKRSINEEVKFQWKSDESNEDVLLRLNDLYKEGMKNYLNLEISAVSESQFEQSLQHIKDTDIDAIKKLFIQQKLYSGNEFAFKEVFDKDSFDKNAIVVKEIVKLLEEYQIKYSHKQQFLGDFFERLLNTGIKQEAGQFFTPIPLAAFICKSLPIKQIIDQKNNNREINFLPYCIDYASGSGHFLTEIMNEINAYVFEITQDSNYIQGGKEAKKRFNAHKDDFYWAKEYIYGIEKDYRLAKTTKISTFLNGDGDANIICGDGLESFKKSKEFPSKLKLSTECKDNPQFDILVANPPYSVSGFKSTLPNGNEAFDLFADFSDQSSEIECLFVERMKQLLKISGVAGIILPSSVLQGNVYNKTREILFKFFEFKGILEIGENAFMETTKNTVVLFLKRIDSGLFDEATKITDKIFTNFENIAFNGIEQIFSKFIGEIYPSITEKEYTTFIKSCNNGEIDHSCYIYDEYYDYYKKENLGNLIISNEKEKLRYFLITYNKIIPIINSGSKLKEKEFLGYEFSKAKGREGIKIYRNRYNKNELSTQLFNEYNLLDPDKANYYIQKSFSDELQSIEITNSMQNNIKLESMHKLIYFDTPIFSKKINTISSVKIECNFNMEKLYKLYPNAVDSGTTAPQDREFFKNGKFPFIRAGNISNKDKDNYVIPDQNSLLNELGISKTKLKKFKAGTILFAKSGRSATTNKIAKLREDSYVVNHLACIYTEDNLELDFLYYYFEYFETSNLIPADSDYPSISLTDIKNFLIPVIDKTLKEKIVSELRIIDDKDNRNKLEEKFEYLKKYFKKVNS